MLQLSQSLHGYKVPLSICCQSIGLELIYCINRNKQPLSDNTPPPTFFWNQIVDKMTKNHSKCTQVGLLVMIYDHNHKFGG